MLKGKQLCYSKSEAECAFCGVPARAISVGTDREPKTQQKSFKIGRRYRAKNELPAKMYSSREVDFARMLSAVIGNGNR